MAVIYNHDERAFSVVMSGRETGRRIVCMEVGEDHEQKTEADLDRSDDGGFFCVRMPFDGAGGYAGSDDGRVHD